MWIRFQQNQMYHQKLRLYIVFMWIRKCTVQKNMFYQWNIFQIKVLAVSLVFDKLNLQSAPVKKQPVTAL